MSRTVKQKKTGGKAVSHQCRNNGECSYCNKNRLQNSNRKLEAVAYSLDTIKK